MKTRQRTQSPSHVRVRWQNQLVPGFVACGIIASLAAPAKAQYQYFQSSSMLGMGAATGLIRTVPMMATGLVRIIPHGHKNKNKNSNYQNNTANTNVTNGSQPMYEPNPMAQTQTLTGVNNQSTSGSMNNQHAPIPATNPPPQPPFNLTPSATPNYAVQNTQPAFNSNIPGVAGSQSGQTTYSTVQGQLAPGQVGYGAAPDSGGTYGPNVGQ